MTRSAANYRNVTDSRTTFLSRIAIGGRSPQQKRTLPFVSSSTIGDSRSTRRWSRAGRRDLRLIYFFFFLLFFLGHPFSMSE